MSKGNIAVRVFEIIGNITKKLEFRNIKSSILNDPSTILYGIIDVINETRIIVHSDDIQNKIDDIAYIVANELGMHHYIKNIADSLKDYGLSVLNPLFVPIIIVELAKNRIDHECINNTYKYIYNSKYIYVPKIEPLIAKLYNYHKYPYTQYSIALFILHQKRIDIKYLETLFKELGVEVNDFYSKVERTRDFFKIFPELSKYVHK